MISKGVRFFVFSLLIFLSTNALAQFENCSNGIDDDGDGKIDCFDSNCSNSPFCISFETNCADGLDNDGDGLPDCLDTDCTFSGVCPVETNCNNGIDDDGDGFFDYYDGDCLTSPDNPNDYITNVADCEVKPQGNVFDLQIEWESEDKTLATLGMPGVGDLDQDGIPEVVSPNQKRVPGESYNKMYILSGRYAGAGKNPVLHQVEVSQHDLGGYPAIADVDGDGFGEIFISDNAGNIRSFEHDLTPKWGSSKSQSLAQYRLPFQSNYRVLGIADFNQDGKAEVYAANEIRDAATGNLIVKGSHGTSIYPGGNHWNDELNAQAVAVDILPTTVCGTCDGLELVIGHVIYAVDIPGKKLTEVLNMNDAISKPSNYDDYGPAKYYPNHDGENRTSTSIVDYDQDGYLDILLSGTTGHVRNGPTYVYYWNLQKNFVRSYMIKDPKGRTGGKYDSYATWKPGVGSINVADIDNDGQLNCTFASGQNLYALDENWNEIWVNADDFQEGSSGFTGTAVFDFDGDGASEIVYRDEIALYIVDGTTGNILGTFTNLCSSNTQQEYPIIADVDGDGETEIVVGCGTFANTKGGTLQTTIDNKSRGFVRVYGARDGTFWVPSRKLWNQFAYFNVNINDNLTVPRYQQYHHIGFAQKCKLLGSGTGFSLNKFLNQSPVINYCGNLSFPSPNLEFADNPIQVEPPVCPDDRFQVRLRFVNTGDEAAFKDIPVSFYADDPVKTYSDAIPNPFLETIYIKVPGGLQVNQLLDTTLWVHGKAGFFTLYASLNDIGPFDMNGSSLSNENFYPLDSLNGTIRECDATPTIVKMDVNPYPFNTTAVLLKNNDNCPGSYNSNGAITAHVSGDTLGYMFRWFKGSTTAGSPDFIGATQKGLTGGKYTVVATHTLANCTGNSSTIDVRDLAAPPVINAEVLSPQRSCDPANPSGELRAYVIQGSNKVTVGYNFFWYKGQNTVIPARSGYTGGATVDQLSAGIYRVVVIQASTGCTSTMDIEVKEQISKPVVSLAAKSDQTICDPASYNGQASVSVNGNTNNFNFYWYSGNVSSPDTTSSNVLVKSHLITGLGSGTYTVFAADKVTRCLSNPLTIKINDKTWKPVVNATVLNPQEACDLSLANGSLGASVNETSKGGSTNVTSGYQFIWYKGNFGASALPAIPTATGSTVNGLEEGKYTLVTRSTTTACQTITYITLPAQKTRPILDSPSVTHTDNCTDPWGSSITVTADGGKTSGYTFQWRNISTNTVLTETRSTLDNIPPGEYGIRVTNSLGCISLNEVKVTVKDKGPKPVINVQTVSNSSCNPGQPNGMLIAKDFGGTASDYTFEWFNNNLSGAPLASTGAFVNQLPAGKYALRITNNTTLCFQVAYATIGTQTGIPPTLDTLSTKATTYCDPANANGEAEFYLPAGLAQLPPDFTDDRTYTFEIYSGTTITGVPHQTNNDGRFNNLNAGAYTAIVIDNYNHCLSPPMTIEIPKAPGITINLDYSTPSSACASNDGALGISVSSINNSSPPDAGYSIQWYYRSIGDPYPGTPDPGTLSAETGFTSERINLPSGYYTIEVYDNFSSCVETADFYLPNADPPKILPNGGSGSLACTPGTGSIGFRVQSPIINLDNYTVYIYAGNSIDPGNEIQAGIILGTSQDESHIFTDLEAGRYTIALQENFGANCFSAVRRFNVSDITPTTEIITSSLPDFSCNAAGTGSLSVTDVRQNGASESLTDFSYTWYQGIGTSGIVVGNAPTVNGLSSGNYTVEVTDNVSGPGQGCTYTKTIYLNNIPKILAIAEIQTLPNRVCTGENGEISITRITENGIDVPVSAYTLTLQDETGNNLLNPGTGQSANPFRGLAEGTYYVLATNNATGCEVLSEAILIDIETYDPEITLVNSFPDLSCTGGQATGMLEVRATSAPDGNTSNYQFTWYAGTDTSTPSIGSSNIMNNLAAGLYTVEVTDTGGPNLGCFQTAIFEVLPAERMITFTLAGVDPTYCDPANGEITVQTIQESYFHNGLNSTTSTVVGNYRYTLLDEDLTVLFSDNSTGRFTGLDEGNYYVQAQNINTDNCLSDPVAFSLVSLCVPPVVTINLNSPQYSNNPDPSTWTGSISIGVTESPDNPVNSPAGGFTYTYEIYKADPNGNPTGQVLNPNNGSSAHMLDSGNYVIIVRNNTTGAVTTNTFYLDKVNIEPEFIAVGQPQTVCYPDGSILLMEITFKDVPDDPSKYTLYLYENRNLVNIADSVVVMSTGDVMFENLAEGAYYLRAKHNIYLLYSEIFEVEISNISQSPRIDLDIANLFPQISCQPEILATGKLAVLAKEHDGNVDTYRYQWYRGNSLVSENVIPGATFSYLDSLASGFYTVVVQNQVTLCSSSRTFYVEDRIEIPQVEVESEPATVCDPALANGMLRASLVQSGSYLFEWYEGNSTSGLPAHSGATWGGLMPGLYTVVATDMITGTCSSLPLLVEVGDASQVPALTIDKLADNSACDPTLANGVLSASVEYSVSDYEYSWSDETGEVIGHESMIGSLPEGVYTLEVKYKPTGCINIAETEIILKHENYPSPTVSIHSHMTNCAQPDGSATAFMYEDNETVVFTWFDEAGNQLPEEQVMINESDLSSTAINLSSGTYYIEAFDLITGCNIPQGSVIIEDQSYAAQHQVVASPATCELNNGKLKIIPQESMTITQVSWTNLHTSQTFESNYQLENAPAGEYTYQITWENGCTSSGSTILSADLNIFNGVSPNGDGDNDVFFIDCIDQFPNNKVKIFNRAGALVYEAIHYDNLMTFFEGVGNRGMYIGNKELPDGTYFYIIDKNNGDKPLTGYLELTH